MKIQVCPQPFDPWAELARYQATATGLRGQFGATATFVGTMRDFNEGDSVLSMTLEHYPGMTERYLESISQAAAECWDLLDTLILHRVGELSPNDPIVLVAVWSVHRADAFAACRHLMEELKSHAPFWKKEQLEQGSRWIEHNTPG